MNFIEDINSKMDTIDYGWVDKDNNKHIDFDNFGNNYSLQSPKQLLDSKLGVCWDQVELERKLFSDVGIKVQSFFIVYYDEEKCPTHTFILFNYNNKVYWYEHAWEKMCGLHEYNDFEQAILDIKDIFIKKELPQNYNPQNLVIYEYETPQYGLSCSDFYKHCEKGIRIDI